MKKVLRTFWCLIVCIVCILSGVMPASASVDATEIVRVAVIDYPNYLKMNEDGSVSGYAYEYLQKIAKLTGWRYEFTEMSFSDAMKALEEGTIDLVPGNQYTTERAAKYDFSSRDMGEGGSVLCVRTDDNRYSYNDYASYDGIRIATLKGTIRTEQARGKLARYDAQAQFVEFETDEACKQALAEESVDAILMSSIRCESEYKILARLDSAELYFCLNKQHPQLKLELDEAMETIHLNNPYYEEELNKKYYGTIPIQLSFTQEEKDYIANAGTIVVAISDDLPPIEYYNRRGVFSGIVPDTFQIISENTGLSFRFVRRGDMEEVKEQILDGQIQLVGSIANTTRLTEQWGLDLTDTYRDNSISLVMNKKVSNYKSTHRRVILREGYPYLEEIARGEGYTDFIYEESFEACMEQINQGAADLSFFPSNCAEVLIQKNSFENVETYLMPNTEMEYSIGVSQLENPLLVSILNKSIAAISDEETTSLLVMNLNTLNRAVGIRSMIKKYRFAIVLIGFFAALVIILSMLYLAIRRKRVNQRLSEALKRADAASSAKTDFLSRMSHDIRTPMNAIIGLTGLAKEESDPEIVRQYLDNIDTSSDFLLGLINDILDLSKIESGSIQLNPEVYEQKEFQRVIQTVIQPLMDAKKITFVFEMQTQAERILVDKLRYNQIFFNLLSNASKFTPYGGKVEFIVEPLPEKNELYGARYRIRDNGIGMSSDYLPHLFEVFSQENSRTNEQQTGTGLGLPIVKSLVDAMNGTISVESEPGKGTEFVIELYTPRVVGANEEKESIHSEYNLEKARILIVEDNHMNVLVAQKLLEKEGCIVVVARDGQQAVDLFTESEPGEFQAILMDIRMPIMDGITATGMIRRMERSDAKTIPIIAMTADAFAEEQKKTLEAGMNYHLSKPIQPKEMYEVLSTFIHQNQ